MSASQCTRAQFLKMAASAGALACGSLTACSSSQSDAASEKEGASDTPELKITSSIYGTADTGNKSTLKKTLKKTEGPGDINICHYDDTGKRVAYPEGTIIELDPVTFAGYALLDLGDDIDDSKIDSSKAVVEIAPGDGYLSEELSLSKTSLGGSWSSGKLTYALEANDLSWNMDGYPLADENSGREWSCFGGGWQWLPYLQLPGTRPSLRRKRDSSADFPGPSLYLERDATDMAQKYNSIPQITAAEAASGIAPTSETQWSWIGDGDKLCLCNQKVDNFYAVWPEGSDASGISQADVSVTLLSQYGDIKKLGTDDYRVFASAEETQIAVTYVHWPMTPVYAALQIDIAWTSFEASHTFDITSVYVNEVQQGKGGVTQDGTVTAWSFYGLGEIDDVFKLAGHAFYILKTQQDGSDAYYAEDSSGTPYFAADKSEAMSFDASGSDECNQQLLGNTVYATTRIKNPEEHEVDGNSLSFARVYTTNTIKTAAELAAENLPLASGYALGDDLSAHAMWSWQDRFLSGYTPDRARPTSFPYTTFPYGY